MLICSFPEYENGTSPALEYISSITDPDVCQSIFDDILALQKNGLFLSMQSGLVKKISPHKFYELRSSYNGLNPRLLFIVKNDEFLVLHGFTKKDRSMPGKEIKTMLARMSKLE